MAIDLELGLVFRKGGVSCNLRSILYCAPETDDIRRTMYTLYVIKWYDGVGDATSNTWRHEQHGDTAVHATRPLSYMCYSVTSNLPSPLPVHPKVIVG